MSLWSDFTGINIDTGIESGQGGFTAGGGLFGGLFGGGGGGGINDALNQDSQIRSQQKEDLKKRIQNAEGLDDYTRNELLTGIDDPTLGDASKDTISGGLVARGQFHDKLGAISARLESAMSLGEPVFRTRAFLQERSRLLADQPGQRQVSKQSELAMTGPTTPANGGLITGG